MKKMWLLVGLVVGFMLGSRSGRAPYERAEAQVRQLSRRPEVRQATNTASEMVHEKVGDLVDKASDKVGHTSSSSEKRTA